MIEHDAVKDIPTYLPGVPPQYGIKWPSPQFTQGSDVMLEFPLYVDSSPLDDLKGWKLELWLKKGVQANNVLWRGTLGDGLYHKHGNIWLFRIPAADTAQLLAGTYFYAVKGTKLVDKEGFALNTVLGRGSIEISVDASSPNSKLFGYNHFLNDNENTMPLLNTDLPPSEERIVFVGL
jgi:hypothetical protein